MSKELYTAYWSGGEPTGPGHSPTLDQTPDYIDVVELFEVGINDDGTLNAGTLTKYNTQDQIKVWMHQIRKRQSGTNFNTRFTLSVLGGYKVFNQDPKTFAKTIKAAVDDWGVDGVTIDYEPLSSSDFIVAVVTAIRAALGESALMIAPIFGAWLGVPARLLYDFAQPMTYIETMDYSPYGSLSATESAYNSYAAAIGPPGSPNYGKILIGVSCENPATGDFTPLADVKSLCAYEPGGGTKGGIMLFTTSYDITTRPKGGTGLPNGTFTKTIHEHLPV